MSEARKRAEEALAHHAACPGGGKWRECSSSLAEALRALLAEEPGAAKGDSMHAPQPERADLPPEVREAADAYRLAAQAADDCTCTGARPCYHEYIQDEAARTVADLVLSALAARRGDA